MPGHRISHGVGHDSLARTQGSNLQAAVTNLRPIDGIVVFGAYLGCWILVVGGLGSVLSPKTLVLASTIVPPGAAYLLLRSATDAPLRYIGLVRADSKIVLYTVLASLAVVVPVISLESVVLFRFRVPQELLDQLGEMIRARSVPQLVYVLLVAAAGAALGEELVFRGILQRSLAGWFRGRGAGWPPVLVASLAFSVLHDAWRLPAAFVLGVFLGIIYWRTGSLVLPIIAHFTINCVAIVALYLAETRGENMFPEWVRHGRPAPLWLVGLSLAFLGPLMRSIWKSAAAGAAWQEGLGTSNAAQASAQGPPVVRDCGDGRLNDGRLGRADETEQNGVGKGGSP